MTKSNFEKITKQPMFARPPLPEEGVGRVGYGAVPEGGWAQRAKDRPDGAIRDGRIARVQGLDKEAGEGQGQDDGRAARRHEGRLHREIWRRIAMLSLLKRKPKPPVVVEPRTAPEPVRRTRQQNIKVSEDCSAAFAALAEAQGISKAALFEDMVAERLEAVQRRGFELGSAKR